MNKSQQILFKKKKKTELDSQTLDKLKCNWIKTTTTTKRHLKDDFTNAKEKKINVIYKQRKYRLIADFFAAQEDWESIFKVLRDNN